MKDSRDPSTFDRALWPKTAIAPISFPALDGEIEADVAVVGGGYTGISAALHLAKAGKRVVLLEGHEVGYGASGRNAAGFLPFYLDRTPQVVRKLFGDRAGEALNQMVAHSGRLMLELIAHYHIEADVRPSGLVLGGHDPTSAGRARMLDLCDQWKRVGQAIDILEREQMVDSTGTEAFAYGLLFHDSGTLNPMSLARGLARAAVSEGASIFTRSMATQLVRRGSEWCANTTAGAVIARNVLIATDGYAANGSLWPTLEKTMYRMPAAIVASKPLPELKRVLSPRGFALADDYTQSHLYLMFDSQDRLVASLLPPRRDNMSAAEVARPFERNSNVYSRILHGATCREE